MFMRAVEVSSAGGAAARKRLAKSSLVAVSRKPPALTRLLEVDAPPVDRRLLELPLSEMASTVR